MGRYRVRAKCFALLFLLGLSLPALASKSERQLTAEADQFITDKPEALQPFFHTLYMEGEWNAVLNLDLLALAALEVHRIDYARTALDQASERILRIYANDPNAAQAKSLWSAESVKDFKGEPYERAMTFYYRGLIYLADGDVQNARAAFLQADLQNAMGQSESYDRSFSLPVYLAAWASECDGDHERALDLRKAAMIAAVDPYYASLGDDFPKHLTLMERGVGPEKVTLGDAKSILGFLPEPDLVGTMQAVYADAPKEKITAGMAANLDWLALTRGGRPIQGILDGKATFKQTTGKIGAVSSAVGAASFYASLGALGANRADVARNLGLFGAGISAVGALASLASDAANAEADTRYWASLPKFMVLEASPEEGLAVQGFSATISKAQRPVALSAHLPGNCSLDLGREVSALSASQGGVGNPDPWPAQPVETHRASANEAFRKLLKSAYP